MRTALLARLPLAWLYRGAFNDAAFQALCSKVSELVSAQ